MITVILLSWKGSMVFEVNYLVLGVIRNFTPRLVEIRIDGILD